jgi:hypothetical protein
LIFSIKTISITTFSIPTLSTGQSIVTLSVTYAECPLQAPFALSVVMLNVVMLSVVMLRVVAPH